MVSDEHLATLMGSLHITFLYAFFSFFLLLFAIYSYFFHFIFSSISCLKISFILFFIYKTVFWLINSQRPYWCTKACGTRYPHEKELTSRSGGEYPEVTNLKAIRGLHWWIAKIRTARDPCPPVVQVWVSLPSGGTAPRPIPSNPFIVSYPAEANRAAPRQTKHFTCIALLLRTLFI